MSVVQTHKFFGKGGGGPDPYLEINNDLVGPEIIIKMSSFMPFAFNAVELYFVNTMKNLGHVQRGSAGH